MCEMIRHTIVGYEPLHDVRLFVFPEFSHVAPIYDSVRETTERLAVELPGKDIEPYIALAREYGCYIQTGTFLERDPAWPNVVFNTTMLIGPKGVLSKYRKVNPWLPWELHASPHDLKGYSEPVFPVVDTELGRIGAAICFDWLFPETIRQLVFNGAEILLRVSAYMDPWGTAAPMDWWTLINRTRALENHCFVVASNQASTMTQFPPFSWPGGSMIVDYDGRILSQADPGPGEKVVIGPVDIDGLRFGRQRRMGHDTRSLMRTEMHTYLNHPQLAPAGADQAITTASSRHRIKQARSMPHSE